MSMADRMAVLRDGSVQQVATPEDIYHRPVNRFVATTIGSPPMNFLPATARRQNGSFVIEHASFTVRVAGDRVALDDGAACFVGIRPEDVHVGGGDVGIPANVFVTEPLGGETVVDLHLGDRVVKALAPPTDRFATDEAVRVTFDPRRLHLFDAEGDALASAAGESYFEVGASPG
jgi:ABC-type sugar transport system ATPase subunit